MKNTLTCIFCIVHYTFSAAKLHKIFDMCKNKNKKIMQDDIFDSIRED